MFQLILNFFPSLKDKGTLQPLDIDALQFHWSHRGYFDLEQYQKVLEEKTKRGLL